MALDIGEELPTDEQTKNPDKIPTPLIHHLSFNMTRLWPTCLPRLSLFICYACSRLSPRCACPVAYLPATRLTVVHGLHSIIIAGILSGWMTAGLDGRYGDNFRADGGRCG